MGETRVKKEPSLVYALFTVVLTFSILMVPAVFMGVKTQPLFLISWMIAFPLCMYLGYSFKELQANMIQFMTRCLTPLTIVLCVGGLVGIWNASGTVAFVTKICLSAIQPKFFMVMAFIICWIFTMFTGTSFGTCGTAGIALMGVGLSMGLNPATVAAPIITGAFFGDAFSPLSDSTNVGAGSVGVDLFKSIQYQAVMTIPSIAICMIIYLIWGFSMNGSTADISEIASVIEGIQDSYRLGIITLIPLIVVLAMLLLKCPSIPSILSGAVSGLLVAWLYQGYTFKEAATFMYSGFVLKSESDFLIKVFSRGGVTSMSGIAFMILFAFGLFGLLGPTGIIDKVVEPLTKRVKTRLSGTVCTVLLGLISNVTTASGNFSFVFVGNLMRPVYEKNHLNKWDLTRAMSVGCLLAGLLVPWNSNPLTVCAFLDVEPIEMIPYMYAPFISFVVLLIINITNIDKKFSKMAREENYLSEGGQENE